MTTQAHLDRAALVRHMVGHDVAERTTVTPPQRTAADPIEVEVHTATASMRIRISPGEIVGLGGVSRLGFVNPRRERRLVEPMLAQLRVVAERMSSNTRSKDCDRISARASRPSA